MASSDIRKQKFLLELESRGQLKRLLPTLNWLLMDEAFSEKNIWKPNVVASFTKQYKAIVGFKKDAFRHEGGINYFRTASTRHSALAMMSSGNSEGKDLIRHIRNALAHGFARLYDAEQNGGYIEFLDFKNNGKKKRGSSGQTACIVLSVSQVEMLYETYQSVEKAARMKYRQARKRS